MAEISQQEKHYYINRHFLSSAAFISLKTVKVKREEKKSYTYRANVHGLTAAYFAEFIRPVISDASVPSLFRAFVFVSLPPQVDCGVVAVCIARSQITAHQNKKTCIRMLGQH